MKQPPNLIHACWNQCHWTSLVLLAKEDQHKLFYRGSAYWEQREKNWRELTCETYQNTQEQQKTNPETVTTDGFARFCEHNAQRVLSGGRGIPSLATCLREPKNSSKVDRAIEHWFQLLPYEYLWGWRRWWWRVHGRSCQSLFS